MDNRLLHNDEHLFSKRFLKEKTGRVVRPIALPYLFLLKINVRTIDSVKS